jgi:O-antigen biosynthesis protein WbqV
MLLAIGRLGEIPRSAPIIQLMCLVALLSGSRLLRRAFAEGEIRRRLDRNSPGNAPILLIGAGEGASLLIRALKHGIGGAPCRVVGIVDLTGNNSGRHVLGVPILGGLAQLDRILERLSLSKRMPGRIVLTVPLAGAQIQEIQAKANALNVALSRMPSLTEFKAARADGRLDLRPIAMEDLLHRPQVQLNEAAIDRMIEGGRALVTGAGGSIGAELCRQIAKRNPAELTLLDASEYNLYAIDMQIATEFPHVRRCAVLADIRDADRMKRIFMARRPELVFHAAALKHVPLVEANVVEGVLTNVIGTRNVAEAALACGATAFVQVSTDKAVNPTSVMGASKRLAEYFCQALDSVVDKVPVRPGASAGRAPRFMTVRFGNVLGSSGSVVPLFQAQLQRGGPITVTHPDVERYFMTIREAAELVLQASACSVTGNVERGRIFVLDMGKPMRVLAIAEQMVRLAGLEPHKDVEIQITGLRRGEKLYEELFDSRERQVDSGIDGVLAAASKPMDLPSIRWVIDFLAMTCERGDDEKVLRVLTQHVPGFEPIIPFAGKIKSLPEPRKAGIAGDTETVVPLLAGVGAMARAATAPAAPNRGLDFGEVGP